MAPPRLPEPGSTSLLPGLLQACPELQQAKRIVVGFSGGIDSTVLLHLLCQGHAEGRLKASLQALHVNHALQADADLWEEHCRKVCAGLHVPFTSVRTPVSALPGESLEESARNARHGVFTATLASGDVLALAQHRDDQVETVLFRLLRGSGAAGLAGMPYSRPCGCGLLVRPLLNVSRAELESFALSRHLAWIEDGSNMDLRFDRNFLRHSVLPQLRERWPGLDGAVERSARLSAEAAELLDELAREDLTAATTTPVTTTPGTATAQTNQLRFEPLLPLSPLRQRNALRYWLQQVCAQNSWAVPTHQVLERAVAELIPAAADAEPLLTWGEGARRVELRRHRALLHVLAPLPPVPDAIRWSTSDALVLPAPLGMLTLRTCSDRGLPRDRLQDVSVRFRSGGELVKAAGRPTRPLKKILQEAGIPPWLRERIPLLYVGDELVAIADLLICEGWLSDTPENCCHIVWLHPDLDCGYPPHLLI